MDAFFEPLDDDRYRATELTRGPWDPGAQHAGPPSALLGGAVEAALGAPVVRVTMEILRPVRITDLTVSASVVRPGRSVQLAEGTLADADGPVLLARAWSIRTTEIELPASVAAPSPPATLPDAAELKPFFATGQDVGYHTAMDVRFVHGGFTEPGPAFAWFRPRVPIVAGMEVTPLQRVLVMADSGNGISSAMPPSGWLFINTDLTVALHRQPVGDWVAMDAETTIEPTGVGLATSILHDTDGPIGRGLQSLLVAPR